MAMANRTPLSSRLQLGGVRSAKYYSMGRASKSERGIVYALPLSLAHLVRKLHLAQIWEIDKPYLVEAEAPQVRVPRWS